MNYAGVYIGPSAPDYLVRLLKNVGGTNIYGRPNFRLVHAGFRLEPAGGTWIEWPSALGVNERTDRPRASRVVDEHGKPYTWKNQPERRVVEVRLTLKYPEVRQSADGAHWWVLEKWHPPEIYGGPVKWYLPASSGGTLLWIDDQLKHIPSQGDFPYDGAYEHTNYEFPQCALSEAVILTAVQRINRMVEDRPQTAYGRMLRRVWEQQELEKRMSLKRRQQDYDLLNECDTAFGNNPTSFGGGKKRKRSVNTFAERAGVRNHTGVS